MPPPEKLLSPTNDLLLGIVGGGSKTVAWLAVRAGGEPPIPYEQLIGVTKSTFAAMESRRDGGSKKIS